MKQLTIIAFFVITLSGYAQEKGTYQSDSIYKANKVKLRRWYLGTNKILSLTTFYDREGRLIKYQVEPTLQGTQTTTHYQYDEKGVLMNQVDSIRNGKPNQQQIENLKKTGVNVQRLTNKELATPKPAIEIAKYEITYETSEKVRIRKYNADGSIDYIDTIEENGKKEIRQWYRDNKIYRVSTAEYQIPFLKYKYYGREKGRSRKKHEWNYTFTYDFQNGSVKKSTRFDQGIPQESVLYFYNDSGLLVKTESPSYPEFFEYEYYSD